jgi:thymidylate kinase
LTIDLIIGIQFENDVAPCNILIYFDVPDEVMTKRLVKRGETSGRIDDNEETIIKRLKTFHEETTPILGYYGKQGKLVTIDANRKSDEVFFDVSNELDKLGKQLAFILSLREFSCDHTDLLCLSPNRAPFNLMI